MDTWKGGWMDGMRQEGHFFFKFALSDHLENKV